MDLVLPKNFAESDAPQIVAQARPILDLPLDAQVRVESVTQNQRGTRIEFSYTHAVALDDNDLQEIAGVRVDVSATGNLRFNARGSLVTYNVEPADPRQLRAISDHLSKLVANGEVYIAKPGEQIDPEQLRRQGKSWYLEQDSHGNKQLKRAWIS